MGRGSDRFSSQHLYVMQEIKDIIEDIHFFVGKIDECVPSSIEEDDLDLGYYMTLVFQLETLIRLLNAEVFKYYEES